MTPYSPLEDLGLELAWSLWGELGVRGVVRGRHEDWSIDPEALVVFTARVAGEDPRLRDEALDWCINNERHVSRARLKGILRRADEVTREAFGPFAATVAEHTGHAWPMATEAWSYQTTRRSTLASLAGPSLIRLRLRALFGVGARSEILHAFVAEPHSRMTAAGLARLTGYSKRNIAEELDQLALAGLLQVATPTNQWLYRLTDPDALLAFVGERPRLFPNWEPALRVVAAVIASDRSPQPGSPTVQTIEWEKLLAGLAPDLHDAEIAAPPAQPRWRPGGVPKLGLRPAAGLFKRRWMGRTAVGDPSQNLVPNLVPNSADLYVSSCTQLCVTERNVPICRYFPATPKE